MLVVSFDGEDFDFDEWVWKLFREGYDTMEITEQLRPKLRLRVDGNSNHLPLPESSVYNALARRPFP